MNSDESLSVVIPVFNAAEFIENAVVSALSQPEVSEIVLVEDGSADGSLVLCKMLANKYDCVKLIQHKGMVNKGAGASRNIGILNSTSYFISFLDADDYFLPERFINDIRILREIDQIDGVYNAIGTEYYDKELEQINNSGCGLSSSHITSVTSNLPPEVLFDNMSPIGEKGCFHCDGLTVRKTIFTKSGMFDEELELSQDTHMWMKMAMKARLCAGELNKPVAMRGVHIGNRIADKGKLNRLRPLMYKKLVNWARENHVEKERQFVLYERYIIKTIQQFGIAGVKVIINEDVAKPGIWLYKAFFVLAFKVIIIVMRKAVK